MGERSKYIKVGNFKTSRINNLVNKSHKLSKLVSNELSLNKQLKSDKRWRRIERLLFHENKEIVRDYSGDYIVDNCGPIKQ